MKEIHRDGGMSINDFKESKVEIQNEVLNITAKLWNKYLEIPKEENHPDDNNDVRYHIHAIQNIMFTQLYKKQNK